MLDDDNIKISIYAANAEKIEDIEELKSKNCDEITSMKVVQSESLVSMEVYKL